MPPVFPHISRPPGVFFMCVAVFCAVLGVAPVRAMSSADSLARVRSIHVKACNLMYSSPDSAVRLANELLDFAGSGCPLEQTDAHYIKALYLILQGRFADVHGVAEDIARIAYVHDQPVLDKAHLLHGIAFRHQHQPIKALENLTLALNYAILADNPVVLASVLNEVGETLLDQRQPATAMKYFELAADEAKKCEARRIQAQALHNIGSIHLANGDPASALTFALQGLRLRRDINANADLSASYALVVRVHIVRKDYDHAEQYINHAIRHDSMYRFGPSLAELYAIKGEVMELKKQKLSAIAYYERAASTAGWCNDDQTQVHCFGRLAELYKGQREYQSQYQRLYADLKATQIPPLDPTSLAAADERMMRMLGLISGQPQTGGNPQEAPKAGK